MTLPELSNGAPVCGCGAERVQNAPLHFSVTKERGEAVKGPGAILDVIGKCVPIKSHRLTVEAEQEVDWWTASAFLALNLCQTLETLD
jgi:hypothetical protein